MILFALLVANRVNSNCYKAQRRIYTKVAFTCVMDYTSLTRKYFPAFWKDRDFQSV